MGRYLPVPGTVPVTSYLPYLLTFDNVIIEALVFLAEPTMKNSFMMLEMIQNEGNGLYLSLKIIVNNVLPKFTQLM